MFTSFIKSSAAYTSDKIDCPEKRLFIAILSQAVHDAFSDHVPRHEKQVARNFLLGNSRDFKLICEMAGRNPNYVKEKVRKRLQKLFETHPLYSGAGVSYTRSKIRHQVARHLQNCWWSSEKIKKEKTMDRIYRLIEVYAGRLSSWAWDKRWKYRDHHKWLKGYREWKKSKCPHN